VLVVFHSYECAMENSNRAETAQFAEHQMTVHDGPPTFDDLDVVDDRT
jgi:hypothetical protein